MPKINVDSDYFTHPKTKKLGVYIGPRAEIYPIKLWCFCAKYHPKDGILNGYSAIEIERLLDFDGPPGNLISALVKVGFLEKIDENKHAIHDWLIHAEHVYRYQEHGRRMAKKRWKSKTKLRMPKHSYKHPTGNTIELNGIELNKDISIASAKSVPHETLLPRRTTDIQKLVKGWKVLAGIPIEGPESAAWDKGHFARHAKTAKQFLDVFGDVTICLEAMEYVWNWLSSRKLDRTFETLFKRSDLYRETM